MHGRRRRTRQTVELGEGGDERQGRPAAATSQVDDVEQPPPKRGRQAAPAEPLATNASPSPAPRWLHVHLDASKRAAWDRVLRAHYYLQAPSEFFDLFELAVHLNPEKPTTAFQEATGIRLGGPFALVERSGGAVHVRDPLCLHDRYYYDPPEVVTVLIDERSTAGAHWAYVRDQPRDEPVMVVYSPDARESAFDPVASSLFDIIRCRLLAQANGKEHRAGREELRKLLESYLASKSRASVKSTSQVGSERRSVVVAPSLSGLGIVVSYDRKKRTGFRELPVHGEKLRALLTAVTMDNPGAKKKAMELVNRATIANDECDFGTGLLLGLDLFTAGQSLQKEAGQLLKVAYMLLGRKDFAKVVTEHLRRRSGAFELWHPLECLPSEAQASSETAPTSAHVNVLELP